MRNRVVANTLPFPFNIRAAMRVWDWLYFTDGRIQARPEAVGGMESRRVPGRRAHRIAAPATRRRRSSAATRPANICTARSLQGWFAPDITNDNRRGIGGWSADDVVAYLKTGHNRDQRRHRADGGGGHAVELEDDRQRPQGDRDLSEVDAGRRDRFPPPLPADDPAMVAGAAIYRDQCSACHGLDGKGVPKLFPSLAESSMVRSDDPTTLIRIVLRGARSVATTAEPTAPGMPSFGWQLDDAQVAAVMTYIRNAWGSGAAAVSSGDVAASRADLRQRTD